MNREKIQQQAAASVDELLKISEDISKYIIPAYGKVPKEVFDMQCRVQLERCRRLNGKLAVLLTDMEEVQTDPNQMQSIQATKSMVMQNQCILYQKEELLRSFLAHSDRIQECLEESGRMENEARLILLKNTLRKELEPCQTERKKEDLFM